MSIVALSQLVDLPHGNECTLILTIDGRVHIEPPDIDGLPPSQAARVHFAALEAAEDFRLRCAGMPAASNKWRRH